MSIMGYILGLGDRHLENINVDTVTGDTFHVDMNSLFNVSETYKVSIEQVTRLNDAILNSFLFLKKIEYDSIIYFRNSWI